MWWKNPFIKLHFLVFLWGFTSIIGKLITLEALNLVFYRLFFAALVLFAYLLWRKDKFKLTGEQFVRNFLLGAMLALHWVLFFYAIKVSNVSVAISTLSTGALFTALLEPLLLKKKFQWYELFFASIIIVCMSLIFKVETNYSIGIISGIGCSFLSALFSVLNANTYKVMQVRKAVFYQLSTGAFFTMVLIILIFGDFVTFPISTIDAFWLILLGALFTAYPMIESFKLMKHISPFTLLISVNLETVYAIVLAYVIWGQEEQMSLTFYVCTLIMLLSIIGEGAIKSRKTRLQTISKNC